MLNYPFFAELEQRTSLFLSTLQQKCLLCLMFYFCFSKRKDTRTRNSVKYCKPLFICKNNPSGVSCHMCTTRQQHSNLESTPPQKTPLFKDSLSFVQVTKMIQHSGRCFTEMNRPAWKDRQESKSLWLLFVSVFQSMAIVFKVTSGFKILSCEKLV